MKNLFSEVRSYCVGRYLIDVPVSFTRYKLSERMEDNLWEANISRPDDSHKTYILTKKMYHPAFLQFIQRREKELGVKKTVNIDNMPFLKKAWPLSNGGEGVIFERNDGPSTSDFIRVLEGYLYTNGVAIKLQKQTINDSDPRYEKQRDGDHIRNDVAKDVQQMQTLMVRISGRDDNDIPTESGSCMTNAFIATDPSGTEQEDISVGVRSDKLNNIRLILETDNFVSEEDSVLDRIGEIEHNLAQSRGYIERKGTFSANGLKMEEFLAAGLQAEKDAPRYRFELYVNEMNSHYKTPSFTLSLDNEGMAPTAYSKEELITFWDTISHTIRLRPGAF